MRANTSNQQISMLESGKRRLTDGWMRRIAKALNVRPAELLETDIQSVNVIGAVEAGVWAEAVEWAPGDRYDVYGPRQSNNGAKLFGLEVRGPSMNKKYPPGTVLICASLVDLGEEPQPGRRYVVHTTRGGYTEATVKLLNVGEDGVLYLWPESSHPQHQLPIPMVGRDEGDEVVIQAKVLYSIQPEI